MANKIVKYKLTDAGTIPTWIDDGGYYPDTSEVMIGATVDGSDEVGLGELASEADVKTYLDSYTSLNNFQNLYSIGFYYYHPYPIDLYL